MRRYVWVVAVALVATGLACDAGEEPSGEGGGSSEGSTFGSEAISRSQWGESLRPDAAGPTPDAFELPDTCDDGRTYCEQSEALGLRDGRAYGKGVSLVDVDGDGWVDIWRSDSGVSSEQHELRSGLYRNLGNGSFEPMDVGFAEKHMEESWLGLFGDVDGDRNPDLLLMNGGYRGKAPLALYRNELDEQGRFVDATGTSGLKMDPARWWGGAFGDVDGDGDADLVAVARGKKMDPGVPPPPGEGPELHLFLNDGSGRFDDVTTEWGLSPHPAGDMKNPVWIDYDRDGDLDLLIIRLFPPHNRFGGVGLYENVEGTHFEQVDHAVFPGSFFEDDMYAFATAVADFDQDGWPDIYLGRGPKQDYIMRNQGDGTFERLGEEIGLNADYGLNTMGLNVGDMTGNGQPDVFVGPGKPNQAKPPVVYCNADDELRFERCEEDFEAAVPTSRWHGVAFGDLNRDFRTDVVTNLGGCAVCHEISELDARDWLSVFMDHGERDTHAVRVRLVGTESTTRPVGAQLRLDGSRTVYRTISSAQGFQSMNDAWKVLPLGDATHAELHVDWPSGRRETFHVQAGTEVELVEGSGGPCEEGRL